MRLVRSRQGLRLASVSRSEFLLLELIAPTADYSDSPALRRRLFPDPVSAADGDEAADTIREDWLDFVVPQMEKQLLEAQETVRQDIAAAQPSKRKAPAGSPARQSVDIFVPAQHAEAWYSALNQARLAIHCRAQEPPQLDTLAPAFFLQIQSDFYAMIQAWLLETFPSDNNSPSSRQDAPGPDDPR